MTAHLLYFVPGSATTDSFSIMLADEMGLTDIMCPGCSQRFAQPAFCDHVNVSADYIQTHAVRVLVDGTFFAPKTACAKYTHACDLAFEMKSALGRALYVSGLRGKRVFGMYTYPASSRARLIAVQVTDLHLVCALCDAVLTTRRGNTATSALHFIAAHFMIAPSAAATMREIVEYETTGVCITDLL